MKTILHHSHEVLRNSNLIKSNSKVSLLAIATLAISVGATDLKATDALKSHDAYQIGTPIVSPRTLERLNMVSDNTPEYIEGGMNRIVNCINTTSPSLSNEQQDAVLKQISDTQQFKDMFVGKLKQKVGAGGYAFVMNSPIASYLNKALLADGSYSRVNGYDIYQGNKAAVDQELFGNDETNDTFKNAVAQHLFNKLKIYVPSDTLDTTVADLCLNQGTDILYYLKEVKASNRYVKFTDLQDTKDLNITKHHIVITDTEMDIDANKARLHDLLNLNCNHEIVLDVGESFVQNGTLNLTKDHVPNNLKHLTITNSSGNVITIGMYFLLKCENLTSFDSSGLTNAKRIRSLFLSGCSGLTSFDGSGLTNVITIGLGFLSGCSGLTSFDGSGLTNVENIEKHFLSRCKGLPYFDGSVLTNVETIEMGFLSGCSALTFFDSSFAKFGLFLSKMENNLSRQITWNIKD